MFVTRSECNRGSLRGILVCGVVASMLFPAALSGQQSRQVLPGTIIPNYDRVRVGQVEGLEGGAFVARTGDSGSNWYNPAGLALADQSALNASATAYEWTTVRLDGLNRDFESGRFTSLGTYVGAVLGDDLLNSDRLRLGVSVTRPLSWRPGAVSGELVGGSGSAVERVDFYSAAEMSTMVPALNAGVRLSDGLRVGGGIALGITSMATTQQLADRLVTGGTAARVSRSLNFDGQYWQLQFTAGVQWEVTEALRFGGTITTPGIRVGGSALLISQSSIGVGATTEDVVFQDDEADFRHELPGRIVAGVAVNVGDLEVEADVRYHGSRDRYELLNSAESSAFIDTDPSGAVTVGERAFEPVTEVTEAVTNLALGLNYPLPGSWRLHGGIFTDGSPVGDPDTSAFGRVDLTGLSFAVSFGGRLSGSVGVSTSWGTTEEGTFGPTLGGISRQTAVDIRTLNLHYALSYTFD